MIKFPASIEKIETLADRSIKVVLNTQELAPEDMAELFTLSGKLGHFIFAVSDVIQESDIPLDPIEFKGDKTPSQRLRGILYVYWKENTDQVKPFLQFYGEYLDKIGERVKEKLP